MGRGSFIALLLASVPALVAGCRAPRDSGAPVTRPTRSAQALVPDREGRVDRSTTGTTGIHGRWVATVDTEDCQKKGKHAPNECSRFVTPDPQTPDFGPTGDLGMCAVGVTAKVTLSSDGRTDYSNIWGARIAFALADEGTYDAPAHGVTGFAFHIDAEPPPKEALRVVLASAAASADPPFWGGAIGESSPVHAGRNEVRWADVGGPIWVEDPPRLDPTGLISLAFLVPADPGGAKAFSFCIADVTALAD